MITPLGLLLFSIVLVIAMGGAYFLLERWIRHRERSWAFLLKQDNNKAMAPLRISACERLIVMLERITPTALVMRQNIATSSAALLQLELVKSIREEFEHNVSLQMYVSEECWEKVRRAKDETTELIKVAYTRVRPESRGMELGQEIFKIEAATGNLAIRDAIQGIRSEMQRHF